MNYDDYKPNMEYPTRPIKPMMPKGVPVCQKCGKASSDKIHNTMLKLTGTHEFMPSTIGSTANPSPQQYREYADALEKWEKETEEYKEAVELYRKAENVAMQRFKYDAIEFVGLKGHPKADKIYALAWEEGHSNGLSEVTEWMFKLAKIVE